MAHHANQGPGEKRPQAAAALSSAPPAAAPQAPRAGGEIAQATSAAPPSLPWDGGMTFLLTVHGRVNDDSRFADSKAAAVIVLGTGLIASLYGAKLHMGVISKPFSQWGLLEPLSAAAYCLLGVGVFLAAWAIKPRLDKAHEKGFVFWASIRGFADAEEFWQAFRSNNLKDLIQHVAQSTYTLAGVCKTKYFWVGLSIWTSFFGAVAAMAAVLLKDATLRVPGT
jgi:hypothetical protein